MDLPLVYIRFLPVDNPEDTPGAKTDCEGLELEGLLEGNQSQDEPWRSGINGAKRANVKQEAGPRGVKDNRVSAIGGKSAGRQHRAETENLGNEEW